MQCIACLNELTIPFCANLEKCLNCGHVFYTKKLTAEEVKEIYAPSYFKGDEYVDYVGDREIIIKNFQNRINLLLNFINEPKEKNVLEVGSAYGFFLEVASKYFKSVEGLEFSREAVEYSQTRYTFKVIEGSIDEVKLQPSSYDNVFLWDTIEHLVSPDKVLQKIFEILKPGGLIALTTGDIASLNAKFRGRSWRMIHPPSHVHYFTKKSISILLNRIGYEVLHISYPGYYRSLDLALHRFFAGYLKAPGIYNFFKKIGITRFELYTNLFDIMFIIARKKVSS